MMDERTPAKLRSVASDVSFYDMAWDEWQDMIKYSPAPRLRREKVLSWLQNLPINTLLDVGCGNAEFIALVHNSFPKLQLVGTDISEKIIESNRMHFPKMSFLTLDINDDTLSEKFDAVVCMEVVEHCHDYKDAIKRLASMTKKYLILSVPCGPVFEIDRRVGHERHFKANEIKAALENAGLQELRSQCWGFPFFNLYKHLINLNADKMCDAYLSQNRYTTKQKIIASVVYASFKLCFPICGYQLFSLSCIKDVSAKLYKRII